MRSSVFALAALALLASVALSPRAARADAPSPLPPSPAPPPVVVATPGQGEPPVVVAADDDRTLLGPSTRHGGYGGPEVKTTTMLGDPAILVGGQAGWIIDRQLVLGGAGYGLATTHSPTDASLLRPEGPSHLQLGYGGFRVGWIVSPRELVHFTAAVLIGAGGVSVVTHDLTADRYTSAHSSAFFALEPSLEMELNLARWIRLGVGGSYRYLGNTGQPGLQTVDLSGPAAGVALKFGVF